MTPLIYPFVLTDLWGYFERKLRQKPNCMDAKIAALQLYSDKTLLTVSEGLSAHPIRAALLNISYGKRMQNLIDVGYLPDIQPPTGATFPSIVWRKVKLSFMSKCLDHLLSSVKKASFDGLHLQVRAHSSCFNVSVDVRLTCSPSPFFIPLIWFSHTTIHVQDPTGKVQLVFPRLFTYVVDDPESKDLTCIRGGNSAYPCEICWVPKSDLSNLSMYHAQRTEAQQVTLITQPCKLQTNSF